MKTIDECLAHIERAMESAGKNLLVIPPAVGKQLGANLEAMFDFSGKDISFVRDILVDGTEGKVQLGIDGQRRIFREGGELRTMFLIAEHCGYHPMALFENRLRKRFSAAVALEAEKIGEVICETIYSGHAHESLISILKGCCTQCGHAFSSYAPEAKFCPECGAKLIKDPQELLGVMKVKVGKGTPVPLELVVNLNNTIDSLEFSVRTANCLERGGIRFVGELVEFSEQDLRKMRNFGPMSLREVKDSLEDLGLSLGMNVGHWKPPVG